MARWHRTLGRPMGALVLLIASMFAATPAKADVFAVVVDTSESMQWKGNDPDHMALLGVLMLSDLLEPENTEDEVIVMPFDGAVTSPQHSARAPVVRRSDFAAGSAGTNLFRDKLQDTLQYKEAHTHFAPSIEQAMNEVSRAPGKHKNRVVILLTDGQPKDLAGEIQAFDERIRNKARKESIKIWTIALGTTASTNNSALEYFRRENLGGFESAPNASDLLPAFAKVLSTTTQRQFTVRKLTSGQRYNFNAAATVDRSDWVVMMRVPGRITDKKGSVKTPGGKNWSPASEESVIREVNATGKHPPATLGRQQGRAMARPQTRSYRRIRLKGPEVGTWVFRPTTPVILLAIHRNNFALKNRTQPATTGPVRRAIPDKNLCFRSQVTSLPNARIAGQPITDKAILNPLKVMMNVRNTDGGVVPPSAPTELLDDSSTAPPHDTSAGDGEYGKCWMPTDAEVGKFFDVEVTLENTSTEPPKEETKAQFARVEVIPRLELDLVSPMAVNASVPMATNDVSCNTFKTGSKASLHTEVGGTWEERASFQVEIGHRDAAGVWVEGAPIGEPISNVQLTLDKSVAKRISKASTVAYTGWEVEWDTESPEHELCVTMGSRSSGGTATHPLTLRFVPMDKTYAEYDIEFDLELDIHATDPPFWEVYGSAIIVLLLAGIAALIGWKYTQPPPLPADLVLRVWKGGNRDREPGTVYLCEKGGSSFEDDKLKLSIRTTRSGELEILHQGKPVRVGDMCKHDSDWFQIDRDTSP